MVGAAETAAPPEIASVPSVEVSSQQEISVRSVGSVGGNFKNVAAWKVCQNSLILKNHKEGVSKLPI